MLISLLDVLMRRQGSGGVLGRPRLPSAGEELRSRAGGGGGILGPAPERPGGVLSPAGPQPAQGRGLPSPQPAQPPAGPGVGGQLQGQGQQPRPDGNRRREPGPGEKGQSFLSRLFTGSLSPGERQALTEEDRDRLLRQGLLTTGLAMLAGNHSGRSFGEVLARGIFAAQQDTAQTAGELLDVRNAQIRLARRAQVFDNPELSEVEKWQEVRRISAKEGDTEAVEQATDVIKQLRELEAGEAEREFRVVNGQGVWIDRDNGRVFNLEGQQIAELPQEARDPFEDSFTKDVVLEDGRTHTVLFDRRGNMLKDLGISDQPAQTGADSAQVEIMRGSVDTIERLMRERDYQPFGVVEETASEFDVTRGFTSPEAQQFRAAGMNLLSLIILARSGKRATDAEVERLAAFALPQPGDDPTTVQSKISTLRDYISALRGEGSPPPLSTLVDGGAGAVEDPFSGPPPSVDEEEEEGS